jgi:hypothetical protein
MGVFSTGCGSSQANSPAATQATTVKSLSVSLASQQLKPTVSGELTPSVAVQMTVNKDAILNQEYLYGADLQYSDYHDPAFNLNNQSMAIGHIPVTFRVAGNELQLVSDNRRLSPSDVDHPELLISRYKILSQTDTTFTISQADSSVFLAEIFEGTVTPGDDNNFNPDGAPPRETWTRSFDYAPQGNYLLQQTSIVTAAGNIAEFMESVFPRANLAPGATFQKFVMDPSSPGGMDDDDFYSRFRFLPGETIYDAKAGTVASGDPKPVAYGEHFDLSPKADGTPTTIDWYVTANAPDEVLPVLKNAVEGWNRYFSKMKEINRDVVQFKGKLPAGIYLGDPRFNVINWDSKRIAGAAYESQATDPATGKQSHSVIYMPAAWLQIGVDYWKAGISSDKPGAAPSKASVAFDDSILTKLSKRSSRASAARFGCMRDMTDSVNLITSGRLTRTEVSQFATELLKQTLFHEVGHSLGLAHNFKGSLSFNRSDAHPVFSNSIMDYNDYEIERAAFDDVDSAKGPLLEYDRQALSAIYNKHEDVAESDASLPVCTDAEADAEDDGIDPLCNRYDIENDPTLSIETALNRLTQPTLANDTSLAQALAKIPALVITDEAVQAAKSEDDVLALTQQLANGLTGSMGFYFVSGKASLGYALKINVKALLEYEADILPKGYSEEQMRARVFEGVQKALATTDLPPAVQTALAAAEKAGLDQISKAPYFSSADSKAGDLKEISDALDAVIKGFSVGETSKLALLRTNTLKLMARHTAVPFFFGSFGSNTVDYEKDFVGLLLNATESKTAAPTERTAAATALMTYKGRLNGDPAIADAVKNLTQERLVAKNSKDRDRAEGLLAILSK